LPMTKMASVIVSAASIEWECGVDKVPFFPAFFTAKLSTS
jgi:hypothetical protein